ncbi:hypothetical protein EDD18DRAFT_1149305 [Armillaria luteobubalina]|uniref:Uncharacterized protein n=1 Tax=Armillaria luteobubalina TaxID=153913 RepID=A0AA39QE96_9AGAR|nr:hypothetical protein EDD18DRAFT_1149305 [Armillaria luteobubalina]
MPRACRVHHHPIIGRTYPLVLSVPTAEQLTALTMRFPNITGTTLSIEFALLDIQNHPIVPSLESHSMIPVRLVPVAIGPVHPAIKDLLAMTGAAAHTEGVELIVETTLIRLPGEIITVPGIAALHLSTSHQDMIEDAKIPRALGVHAAANHYRQNEESDPTVIPNGYQKPKANTTWCMMSQNPCPISITFPMSRACGLSSTLGTFQTSWNVLLMSVRKWLQNGTSQESASFHLHVVRKLNTAQNRNNRVMAEGETRDELFLHLLCLPAALAVPVLTDPSQEPKTIADALWKMQTEWPEGGSLIIEINPGKPVGKVFFPGDHPVGDPVMTLRNISDPKSCQNNIHSPLEVTHTIQQGVNIIRFVQLTGMHKSFVLFASHRDIPILDLTALAELLQFRTL